MRLWAYTPPIKKTPPGGLLRDIPGGRWIRLAYPVGRPWLPPSLPAGSGLRHYCGPASRRRCDLNGGGRMAVQGLSWRRWRSADPVAAGRVGWPWLPPSIPAGRLRHSCGPASLRRLAGGAGCDLNGGGYISTFSGSALAQSYTACTISSFKIFSRIAFQAGSIIAA